MFNQEQFYTIIVLCMMVALTSCGDDSSGPVAPENPDTTLKIKKVIPESGTVGDTVIIKGQGFPSQSPMVGVTFNGAGADVMFASKRQLATVVPDSATTGPVDVSVGEKTVTGIDFSIIDLEVTNIVPKRAVAGDTIKIMGKNFSPIPSKNIVSFAGEAKGNIVSVAENYLEVIVPDSANTGQVEVSVGLQEVSGPTFTINVVPLTISSSKVSSANKRIRDLEQVRFSWKIKGKGSSGNFTCKLDTDGDGSADYTIDPCPKSGDQFWIYRKKSQSQHYEPTLTVTNGEMSDSQLFSGGIAIAAKKPDKARLVVKAAYNNAVALKPNGRVVSWGKDRYNTSKVPAKIQGNVRSIGVGGGWNLYIENDGTFSGKGKNEKGQASVPKEFKSAKNVIEVDGGSNFTLGLKESGKVFGFGRLQTTGGIPKDLSNVTALAAGPKYVLALKSDGSVISWYGPKSNKVGQADVPDGLRNVVGLAASFDYCWKCGFYDQQFSLALKSNGEVVAWGSNSDGQTSVPQGLANVVEIDAGGRNAFALKADGTVVAWGKNSDVPKGLNHVVNIAAGMGFNIAVKADGSVVSWGKKFATPPEELDMLP